MVPETAQSDVTPDEASNAQPKGSRVKRIKSVALKRMSREKNNADLGQ